MLLSIVIPARNAAAHLDRCLLRLNEFAHFPFECIVVDDASEDGTRDVAIRRGARVLRNENRLGPGASRNLGARAARGETILFLDADTLPHAGSLELIAERFSAEPGLDAMFGSYDTEPAAPTVVSRFRNLLHCFTHQNGSGVAQTFWSGCGAIRKRVFEAARGFCSEYRGPEIEDIELGYRLNEAGFRVELEPRLLVTHLKEWRFQSLLYADIRYRGIPWTVLALRTGRLPNALATRTSQRVSVWCTFLMLFGLLAAPLTRGHGSLELAAVGALGVMAANLPFLRFLRRTQGLRFTLAAPPLLAVYNCCCLVSLACGCFIFLRAEVPAWVRQEPVQVLRL